MLSPELHAAATRIQETFRVMLETIRRTDFGEIKIVMKSVSQFEMQAFDSCQTLGADQDMMAAIKQLECMCIVINSFIDCPNTQPLQENASICSNISPSLTNEAVVLANRINVATKRLSSEEDVFLPPRRKAHKTNVIPLDSQVHPASVNYSIEMDDQSLAGNWKNHDLIKKRNVLSPFC